MKAKIDMKQRKLDAIKAKLDFGPDTSTLPIENWASIEKRTAAGAKLVVIDGLVHDVTNFIKEHPGTVQYNMRAAKDHNYSLHDDHQP